MALGYVGNNGTCHLNANVAMYEVLTDLYPRYVNQPIGNTVFTSTTAALEVITNNRVNSSGLITYSTRNNNTNAALQANKTIQLQLCESDNYINDNPNGSAYDYASAAALWGFAFSSVFSLWYLSKNLGLIINAVRRW